MGRPVSKDKIGYGDGRIAVTRHFFTGGAEATTAAHIVRQVGDAKFVVRLDSNNDGGGPFSPRDHASDEILKLVNKVGTGGGEALEAGEFTIDTVGGSDSSVYQVTKLRNKTVQIEGSGADTTLPNANNAIYGLGVFPDDNSNVPNAVISVALPVQRS